MSWPPRFDHAHGHGRGHHRWLHGRRPEGVYLLHRMRVRIFWWFGVAIAAGGLASMVVRDNTSGRGWPLVAALVVVWMASGVIAWRLTRPLIAVMQAARAIGDGDLTVRIRDRGRGELSILASAINDMAARLDKQHRDQRQMLAAVSHELRTPLGHLRVLIETARDAPGAQVLDELDREIIELDRLVDKLLASSRLELAVDKRAVAIDELAAVAVEQAGLAPGIVTVLGDVTAVADATLVRRAIANLVDNARLHGGGATAVVVERRGAEVAVVVDDAGPGVPRGERERVFEPFARAGLGGSLGLGLALVRRIAVAHGGRAWIEDRPGGGARVGFTVAAAA
ncbi:MAG: HAMP domain-containing histidine kinase [Deltaproteobacteria bacterium]|nr:HAMP domain-containing histidine kinase [Deltaproteobacteria bacterium]